MISVSIKCSVSPGKNDGSVLSRARITRTGMIFNWVPDRILSAAIFLDVLMAGVPGRNVVRPVRVVGLCKGTMWCHRRSSTAVENPKWNENTPSKRRAGLGRLDAYPPDRFTARVIGLAHVFPSTDAERAAVPQDGGVDTGSHKRPKRQRRTAMEYFAGLDVATEETAICLIDGAGSIVLEAMVATEPEAICKALKLSAATATGRPRGRIIIALAADRAQQPGCRRSVWKPGIRGRRLPPSAIKPTRRMPAGSLTSCARAGSARSISIARRAIGCGFCSTSA